MAKYFLCFICLDINSIQKLASQSKVKYGTVSGSSVHNFFKETTVSPYYEMASHLVNVPSTEAGVNKTRNESYAFLWDVALLTYYKNKHCNLMTVGQEFRKDGYALGLRKGSPFTNEISVEILKLRQSGFVANKLKLWFVSIRFIIPTFYSILTNDDNNQTFYYFKPYFLLMMIKLQPKCQ